ncbi:hypothetical protein J5285_22750 (plasmid) [Agrobacterium larrymoorei]|uniref:Efflux RND transporter periplasmic adaptor subunit n=1 Tax=Agrobacterium larrymoorei TaxID=160699 RepID=A0ABX8TAS9_9HYPH|nr:hypothetical protein J5285_22750 [Agrobacterium larrymoorei]
MGNGRLKADETGSALLKLASAEGQSCPHNGKLLFSEAVVNAATGQIILRAAFPNPETNLLPGMDVRARMKQASMEGAFAVPQQAVQRDNAGKSQLYLVGQDDKVEVRSVHLGWLLDGRMMALKRSGPSESAPTAMIVHLSPTRSRIWPSSLHFACC